jgi:chromosome segregation ATPase
MSPALETGMTPGNWIELAVAVIGFLGLLGTGAMIVFQAGKLRGTLTALADAVTELSHAQDGLQQAKADIARAQAEMESRLTHVENVMPAIETIRDTVTELRTTQKLQHQSLSDGQTRLERMVEGLTRQMGHVASGVAGRIVELPQPDSDTRARKR